MPSVRVLIVEDEILLAEQLTKQLEALGLEVTEKLERGEDALKSITNNPPDIIIMDIHLAGSMDGIETAARISKNHEIPIIYLTSHTDKRTFQRAKSTKPENFIAKPFNFTDLERAIDLAIYKASDKYSAHSDDGWELGSKHIFKHDALFIKDKDGHEKIWIKDIVYIEADRAYSRIFTEHRSFILTMSLNRLLDQIKHNHLIRLSRSHCINLNKIKRIEGNIILLEYKGKEVDIAVGKTYKDDFFKAMPIVR